jgi:membrane-bound ClpP family serine protease
LELFGVSLVSIYLAVLVISAVLILFSIFFSDIIHTDIGILNPTLLLSFLTILSACGYLLERYSSMNSLLIFGLSALAALIAASCFHFFVLIPLSSAEESLVYKEDSLKGRVGKVITVIPKDGFGEIMIKSTSGNISKTAASFYNEIIENGTETIVVEVKNRICYVVPYDG